MTGFTHATGGAGIARANPVRDRQVPVISAVACPDCGVGVGSKCLNANGAERGTCHPSRRRMAVRAENAAGYSVEDMRYARETTPKERQLARRRSGLDQQQIADLLGLTKWTYMKWESGRSMAVGGPAGAAYGKWLREHLDEGAA